MKTPEGGNIAPSNKRATDRAEIAKVSVIAMLRQGLHPRDAMAQVGRAEATYYTWLGKSTKFRDAAKSAQAAYTRQQSNAARPFRERLDDFEPVMRANYSSRVEYWVAFRKAYFGFDTFDHQWQILEAWDKSPPGGISLTLVPPEAGKTTLKCDVVCADLCEDANLRFAMLSENKEFASKTMGRVQNRFTWDGNGEPPALFSHFGPFVPGPTDRTKKWNSTEFTLLASDHDEQDPSVLSVGMTGTIRGLRWDRVKIDDPQSLRSKNTTAKLLEIFRGDIIERPGKRGTIEITGSRVCRGDFYEELERLDLLDEIVCIPALDMSRPDGERSYFPLQWRTAAGDATPDESLSVEPLCDEAGKQMGWSDAELAQRRHKAGEEAWFRVYMQRPASDFAASISIEDIMAATENGRMVGQRPDDAVANIASMDPSLHAHAALGAYGYDADHLYAMDMKDVFQAGTNQRLFAQMEELTVRYRPDWWVIENNTMQSGYLTDDAFLEMKRRHGFNAVGHHTGATKTDEMLGIPAMMQAIQRREILFPRVGPADTDFALLFDQLIAWRSDIPTRRLRQDMVMQLFFAFQLWKKLRDRVNHSLAGWKRDGLTSITTYPHAVSHLVVEGQETRERAPLTYAQNWDRLRSTV